MPFPVVGIVRWGQVKVVSAAVGLEHWITVDGDNHFQTLHHFLTCYTVIVPSCSLSCGSKFWWVNHFAGKNWISLQTSSWDLFSIVICIVNLFQEWPVTSLLHHLVHVTITTIAPTYNKIKCLINSKATA